MKQRGDLGPDALASSLLAAAPGDTSSPKRIETHTLSKPHLVPPLTTSNR
jgi:hypothetical protein